MSTQPDRWTAPLVDLATLDLGTGGDVVDLLTGHVADLVIASRMDDEASLTAEEFWPAFNRVFDAALPLLMDRIERHCRAGLAAQVRRDLIAEHEPAEGCP